VKNRNDVVQGPAHENRPGAGRKYNRALRHLIAGGKATPSFIVSPELVLDEAPTAYEHFDARDEGWTKVAQHPRRTQQRRQEVRDDRHPAPAPVPAPAGRASFGGDRLPGMRITRTRTFRSRPPRVLSSEVARLPVTLRAREEH